MIMNHNMFSPQHHPQQQPGIAGGMPYNMQQQPGMGGPPNGQFPVVSSGPASMPMMGPNASQPMPQHVMPGMHPQQQQHLNNHPANMNMGTPPTTHPQQHQQVHEQTPSQQQNGGHNQMPNTTNNHQLQMNPNTVTSNSIGAPITNPGQAPSFGPPPQQQQQQTQQPVPQGAMNYPQGSPMTQQGLMHGGGGQPTPPQQQQQQQFNPVGQGMQFQSPMTNGGAVQQGSPMTHGNMIPGHHLPQMGMPPPQGGGAPQQMFNPMMGGGGQNVTAMMHPGHHHHHQSSPMGADMNNIPIYQQQR